jgi:hypothetical protein
VWYGVAIIGFIAVRVLFAAVKATRAGRFGIGHINWKDALTAAIALIMGAVFLYGWFRFPDAPIHQCSGPLGYCGKQGQAHPFADYQAFELWQTTLFLLWPAGMLALFLLQRRKFMRKSI